MENIFVEFLPPWIETGIQPAFYDKESGTVLQQTARMYARVNMLIRMFNKLSKNTKEEVERFETSVNETVNDYIQRFTELKNFVDDYFDNLDVQEEINNKLDQMADEGTLQSIIYEYLNSVALFCYDTVADMKLVDSFVDGSYAKTIGYYSKDDLGGATYMIRTKTVDDTADEMTLIALADANLIAELVLTPEMNVKQFGAKGDGVADDTASIQSTIDNSTTVLIPDGTYLVDALANEYPNGALIAKTGSKIILDNNAKIKMIANSLRTYRIIDINNVNNVEISGGTLEGDRSTHTGAEGEWGHCIAISGTSNNIYIHDIYLKDAWGDGISIGTTGDVDTARVHVDNVRRNGYSVVGANRFTSNDDLIENVNGTAPQCGVDIEPDGDEWLLNNITFNNLITRNNTSNGMLIYLHRTNPNPYKIELNNVKCYNNVRGMFFDIESSTSARIDVNNLYIHGATSRGALFIRKRGLNSKLTFNKPVIDRYKIVGTNNAGIEIEGGSEANGEIYIYNPTITGMYADSAIVNNRAILLAGLSGEDAKYQNIQIIDPIDLEGKTIGVGGVNQNMVIRDGNGILKRDLDVSVTMGAGSDFYLWNTTSSLAADGTINLSNSNTFPIGVEVDFLNTGDYKLNVRAVSQYIYPFTTDPNKIITLNGKGDHLRLKRISDTEWCAVESTGNITHN